MTVSLKKKKSWNLCLEEIMLCFNGLNVLVDASPRLERKIGLSFSC